MKIIWQIRWFSILLVLSTALFIGAIVFFGYRRITRYQQAESLIQIQAASVTSIQNELVALVDNIVLTAMIPTVKQALGDGDSDESQRREAIHLIEEIFLKSINNRDYFDQVRLIGLDDEGKEVVRVDRKPSGIVVVDEEHLQKKGSRYYFEDAIKLNAGEIFVSQIDLNREFGAIEKPHKPMLRIATPVKSRSGESIGIVVINVRFSDLVETVLNDGSDSFQFLIANKNGDYLLHPDRSKTFGFEFGKRYRIQDDFPGSQAIVTQAGIQNPVVLEDSHQQLAVGKFRLLPVKNNRSAVMAVLATNIVVSDSQSSVIQWATVATAFLVLLSLVVAYMTTNFLTLPLQQITQAAKNIRSRKTVEILPVQRDDEIGTLARAFETMATEIKQNERELRTANHQLTEANQDLEHFTHLAAHDLREPLRKQLNLLELLREMLPKGDAAESGTEDPMGFYLTRIEQCSDQMYRMVDDFRQLTRLAGGELTREQIDFDKIIDEALHSFEEQLSLRSVIVKRDPFPTGLSGYPSLLEWLYNNLIANALRYVDRDGFEIAFTATEVDEAGWVFGVRNTGSTIPANQLQEIFKMFRKGDSGKEDSSGIGLSLCRRIIDKHSGDISAESGEDFTHLKFTLKKQNGRFQNSERS
ncbi:sensor histidine kinase [Stieleria sp. JC731]|uniref:sensor histidine kinase n=1 Tax=Pirellulaceae TaxID=2691357 RepID=UPI001E4FD395|nr:sensor histidine kinase [Stieleria sp. JC731]MCC9599935.1 sensor histidine kinase [Stieleria sp. JC731]